MSKIMTTILNEAWCITPQMLETIIGIASRENDLEAVEFKMGSQLENTRTVSRRGNVAVIPIVGSIMRYGNMFTRVSGATSLDVLAQDFAEAEENDEIDTIVLRIDTAGGQASGISEFADRIHASSKKVIAYVDSQCASAGYWIASACDEIVASKTSMIGSIGVVFALQDTSKKDEKDGVENIEIVSRVSPKKRPSLSTEEGKGQIQKWADELGDLFIEAVADFRGVSQETVLEKFGQGDMLISKEAVNVEMIDRIGDFESLISEIQQQSAVSGTSNILMGENSMTLEELQSGHSELYSQIVNDARLEGAEQERGRIQEIDSVNASGYEEMVTSMKFDGKSTANDVKSALFDAKESEMSKVADSLNKDGAELSQVVGEITAEANEEVEQAEAKDEIKSAFASAVKQVNGE